MSYDETKIQNAIVKSLIENNFPFEKADEIAFHMTDWLSDLAEWENFCRNPQAVSNNELSNLLTSFLAHVPSHLAAASKLVIRLPVEDVFKVGAVSEK